MTIIAVDDEKGALTLLSDAIGAVLPDARKETFDNPSKAVAFAEQNNVDIAFLDIHMFGISGLEVAKKIKQCCPKTNIIFVTGYEEFARDAVRLHASGYITKPITAEKIKLEMENLLHPIDYSSERFFAKTFGRFEFFVDGKPLSFKREKSKEVLALLIDNEGASLTTEQIASYIYEERYYDRKLKNTLMPIIRSLQETLQEAGAEEILVKTWGHLAVDTSKFHCDSYDYMAGEPYAINCFRGEYMSNYSWAEERSAGFYWDRVEKEARL